MTTRRRAERRDEHPPLPLAASAPPVVEGEDAYLAAVPPLRDALAALRERWGRIFEAPPEERPDLITIWRGAYAKWIAVKIGLRHGLEGDTLAEQLADVIVYAESAAALIDRVALPSTSAPTRPTWTMPAYLEKAGQLGQVLAGVRGPENRDVVAGWLLALHLTGHMHGTDIVERSRLDTADASRILLDAETAGWIERGALAPCLTRQAWSTFGGNGAKDAIDHAWAPVRTSLDFAAWIAEQTGEAG